MMKELKRGEDNRGEQDKMRHDQCDQSVIMKRI